VGAALVHRAVIGEGVQQVRLVEVVASAVTSKRLMAATTARLARSRQRATRKVDC